MADHPARFRDCTCPGTPHAEEGDIVFLRDTISLRGGLALERDLIALATLPEDVDERTTAITESWLTTLVTYGAVGWNLVDAKGKPLPFSTDAVLDDYGMARAAADAASELYSEAVIRPLLERLSGISQLGSTDGSTSATAQPIKKPSKRSSRATSAGTRQLVA